MTDRDQELSFLLDQFARRAQGTAAVISGSSTRPARKSTAVALLASGSAGRGPMDVLREAFRRAPLTPTWRLRATQLLEEGASGADWPESEIPVLHQTRLMHGLWTVLVRLSERRSVLIGVNDLHLADNASLRCLHYFGRRLGTSRVTLAFSAASDHQRATLTAMFATGAALPGRPRAARPLNSLVADLSYALSDAELRVASLAAVGYSNREIATELHIAISTVEQHLTRTYRKLNVHGRDELVARLLVETSDRG